MSTPSRGQRSKDLENPPDERIAALNKHLLQWKKAAVSGKPLLDQILEIRKSEPESGSSFNPELQEATEQLRAAATSCQQAAQQLQTDLNKLKSWSELRPNEETLKQLQAAETVVQAYQNQTELMLEICTQVGHAKTPDSAVFQTCLWVYQPHLTAACFEAEQVLSC